MVIDRSINLRLYITVLFLTLVVFFLGIAIGVAIDNIRLQSVASLSTEKELDYTSLQFQYLYLSTLENDNASCSVFQVTLDSSLKDLSKSFEKIKLYEEQSNINKNEFNSVLRKYILDNLRYWLFSQKTKELCRTDIVNILYFYSGKHCDICPNQGVVLTYFKQLFGDRLLVFPIDTDYADAEPSITVLMRKYNITVYPSIVIENTKYENVVPKDELFPLICKSFINPQPECSAVKNES